MIMSSHADGRVNGAARLAAAPVQCARAQSTSAAKNESSITLYGGGRFGGSVTDSNTNSTIDLKNGSSFGPAVDVGLDRSRQIELFYSQQDTALTSVALSQSNNVGQYSTPITWAARHSSRKWAAARVSWRHRLDGAHWCACRIPIRSPRLRRPAEQQ
jgi:hypothetical protein